MDDEGDSTMVPDGPGQDPDPVPGEPSSADDADAVADPDDLLAQVARDTATTKFLVALMLAFLVVGMVVIGILVRQKNDSTTTAAVATTTTASTVAPAESAAGKPCVAMVDTVPTGAPPVDVVVGPPPTSVVTKDLKVGTGPAATAKDTVTVNYVGVACSTGKIFDTSYKSGKPVTFPISGVIPGFGQGVTGMQVGGQRLIGIPSDQAYGATGSPPVIAPDEALWFVVELTAITPGS